MALIDCPECGARVSDVAPACPQCGFPVSGARAGTGPDAEVAASGTAAAQPAAASTSAPATTAATSPDDAAPLPTERSAEPLTIGGRPIPIAALLFWGGMVVGLILKTVGGFENETPLRFVPYTMIFLGVLWFAVTEFTLLVRHRRRRT
jgi:hypothetical protein